MKQSCLKFRIAPGLTWNNLILSLVITQLIILLGCSDDPEGPQGGNVPSTPTQVEISAGAGAVVVSWAESPQATSYNIYYSLNVDITPDNGTKIKGATSPHEISALARGVTYYFIVTALNQYGESQPTPPIDFVCIDCPGY